MKKPNQEYFKTYRKSLGFNNQEEVKKFFGAKDIKAGVDYNYIDTLNLRLEEIIVKIHGTVSKEVAIDDLDIFIETSIASSYKKMRESNVIQMLNNQGRRPEEVYFSWMRGKIVSNYFFKAFSVIFGVEIDKIKEIGDDDFTSFETFKRTPKADIELELKNGEILRMEVQSGFAGINDIKQHKILEAKRVYQKTGQKTLIMHYDFFNGQVAFVDAYTIEENNINWVTRQQMEGQTVFNIDQNYFVWKLTDKPPTYEEVKRYLYE